jgi:hypothetical protein
MQAGLAEGTAVGVCTQLEPCGAAPKGKGGRAATEVSGMHTCVLPSSTRQGAAAARP